MKWPSDLITIRHGQSAYNALRSQKQNDEEYQAFVQSFEKDPRSKKTRRLARSIKARFALGFSDYATPLSEEGQNQARALGPNLNERLPKPDVVFISPYLRTDQTFDGMVEGGFDTGEAKIVRGEDRIREQEHGLSLLYSDWRVFHALHPKQKELYDLLGPYWYQYPQGESVSMVRDRVRAFMNMLVREHPGQVVYLISHHLTKLSIRANLERWTPEQFMQVDDEEKPINCGVTHYRGNPEAGGDGKLELQDYNLKLY
jgi:broad specificity phosphatase PhoE